MGFQGKLDGFSQAVVFCAIVGLFSFRAAGTIFYIDTEQGDNANSGRTSQSPWKSIERLNTLDLEPGDQILFKGEQEFTGTIRLNREDCGTAEKPVVLQSYGGGCATINAGNHSAAVLNNCGNVKIRNLKFVGAGRKTGNTQNGIYLSNTEKIEIDSVEVRGFQKSGILVGASEHTKITHVHAHDNGFAGIHAKTYPEINIKKIAISHCVAENNPGDPTVLKNHSGNGILLCGVDEGLVEYCRAANNGWDMPWTGNGPVGIWAWNSNKITIQHCISHDNKTNPQGWDGGGFDFDGGVTNSVLQYNYSYNNAGPGIGLFQFAGVRTWENNVVRYNISVNDGQKNEHGSGIHVWVGQTQKPEYAKALMGNALVYNNLIINNTGHGVYYKTAADVLGFRYFNNIFLTRGEPILGEHSKSYFHNNLYWRFDSQSIRNREDEKGIYADPRIILPDGLVEPIKDPTKIQTLKVYRLLPDSPCIGRGRYIKDNGGIDFWGHALPQNGQACDIGVHQSSNSGVKLPAKPGFSGIDHRILYSKQEQNEQTLVTWQPQDIRMKAEKDHPWWSFPMRAYFVHQDTGAKIELEGFWDGHRDWMVRFAAPCSGVWTYTTSSADSGLNGHSATIRVLDPTPEQIDKNANYRGHIKISPDGRYFQYADGTPFLLLADTLWAANTARCGLGEQQDGPFFQYLADRRAKGFTTILMQYFHGYGDYPDSPGHRNEGDKAFFDPPAERLNPRHFQALDVRLKALWDRGFVAAIPTTWWGKTKRCSFTIEDARRISAYCAVRYGAFNAIWALSGEYQYCFKDCGWTPEQISKLGERVQEHNPYGHPLSIHPSGRTDWAAPHGCQSSRPFHHTKWLDHHWLQTGQRAALMHNIVRRAAENRALTPVKPVFCSEGFYELESDPDGAYHARWQAWVAMLSGCAGYGYGAQGLWQFYDPTDPGGQPGKGDKRTVPWHRALTLAGSSQIIHVAALLRRCKWWHLEPRREALLVDGESCPRPSATDITPPHCAAISNKLFVVYIPRGNQDRSLDLTGLGKHPYRAQWYNPRNGQSNSLVFTPSSGLTWKLPDRPSPAAEDWVMMLESN